LGAEASTDVKDFFEDELRVIGKGRMVKTAFKPRRDGYAAMHANVTPYGRLVKTN